MGAALRGSRLEVSVGCCGSWEDGLDLRWFASSLFPNSAMREWANNSTSRVAVAPPLFKMKVVIYLFIFKSG